MNTFVDYVRSRLRDYLSVQVDIHMNVNFVRYVRYSVYFSIEKYKKYYHINKATQSKRLKKN